VYVQTVVAAVAEKRAPFALSVSVFLRTYGTHALKEAVAGTEDALAATPQSQCAYLRTYETHALKEAVGKKCGRACSCLEIAAARPPEHTPAYVSIRQHTSAYVSIRQHTSAYVSIRQHTSAYVSIRDE
jgi:hypothetical protein